MGIPHNPALGYRPEIDGLRALAVIPVILFHAGLPLFSGGFVGVDIFFVISGYLITSIIIAEKIRGRFSLINFYERRARRILPALFVMMLICLPVAWLTLDPSDLKYFAKSLVAVPTFSSNVLFWLESGYFDATAELKPLLHTWTLAVEEQYYLFFPLLLMLAWGLGRKWLIVLLIVAAPGQPGAGATGRPSSHQQRVLSAAGTCLGIAGGLVHRLLLCMATAQHRACERCRSGGDFTGDFADRLCRGRFRQQHALPRS
nr:acyltransferase [Pseudomonas syringae]